MSHGGKRENAGRKRVKNKAFSRVMRVPEPIAPTIKRVIEALKNNPELERLLLDVIYSDGHVSQLQHMKENIDKSFMTEYMVCDLERNEYNFFDRSEPEHFEADYPCETCLRYKTNTYKNNQFPCVYGVCVDESCYWLPVS